MFEKFAPQWEVFKAKMAGARKSLTIATIAIWQAVVQNIDSIQQQLPQLQQYFGDHVYQYISAIFGIVLLYIRFFRSNEPLETKVAPKDGQ